MPGLQTVSFRLCQEPKAIHGLPWSVMQLVLSLPTLKDLAVDRHRFAPKLLAEEELTLDYCAPLTSFRYTLSDYRWWRKQTFPLEKQALLLVLNKTHTSLERLTLIAELAPLDEICNTLEWPNLRELCLRGERGTIGNPPLPLVSMFANMLRLQRLELKLGLREGVDPQPFWPLGYVAEWPWADLRHLTLSYPLVNDQIYSSLPPTLESLALRYTPHMVHAERYDADVLWNWPLIKSSVMLQILRRCRCRRLSSLQLEYREDEADAELMQCVGASFPALTTFKLLRYRAANDAEAGPLDALLRMLGAHLCLQTIRLHIDHVDTSTPFYRGGYRDYACDIPRLESCLASTQSLADSLAGASGSSLETITLWAPHSYFPYSWFWENFTVVRDETTGVGVRALSTVKTRKPSAPASR
ncbi:uncharacterized protein TRAVEDRAFT_74831 [Trametes versicolor FP-101664 SS1]|uniref:uncharacterized protein n=1 Tax=Trametes versicolor (strain FP-101664) TaxID=717944 RepID=UPI00046240BE|nr:uncharacterized protein TRAVEDRAFT_74831 [Trametes versicolor FP-101664 SS1]EIW53555.1 hypothetical protein TRAVEDRAFT_74831 [Trametes versicolor FP-101664 SS1]